MSPDDVAPHAAAAPADDLHDRFDAFRGVATPPPPPVQDLPAVRRPVTRWLPAAAAAAVVLVLLSVTLVTRTGDTDPDLSTGSPGSSSTTQRVTSTVPSTVTTSSASTTSTDPATTDLPPSTVTTVLPTPSAPTTPRATPPSGEPDEGGAGAEPGDDPPDPTPPPLDPPTTTVPVGIAPPAVVPAGAPVPPGRWGMQWASASTDLDAGTTTLLVRASYVRCPSWPILRWTDDVVVTETDEAIVITISADPTSPHQILQGCPDPPRLTTTDYTVTLAQPLGNRWVYDGSPERSPTPVLILDPNDRAA